jgi:hypothetical protein
MTRAAFSVAMTEILGTSAMQHLLRADRQEDLCFALWRPSTGQTRTTALVYRLLLPLLGERNLHGNASFEPHYFQRALSEAATEGAGIALMHSHPDGRNWQTMSSDDISTESGHAPAVYGATKLPFLGLTIAGDSAWSGRFWARTAPRISSGLLMLQRMFLVFVVICFAGSISHGVRDRRFQFKES